MCECMNIPFVFYIIFIFILFEDNCVPDIPSHASHASTSTSSTTEDCEAPQTTKVPSPVTEVEVAVVDNEVIDAEVTFTQPKVDEDADWFSSYNKENTPEVQEQVLKEEDHKYVYILNRDMIEH